MNLPVEVIEAVNEARCVLFVGSKFPMEAAEAAGAAYPEGKELALDLGWKRPRRMMGTRKKHITPSPEAGAEIYETAHGRAGTGGQAHGPAGRRADWSRPTRTSRRCGDFR